MVRENRRITVDEIAKVSVCLAQRKKIFIRLRSHWRSAKLVKDATKKTFFLTELSKLVKRWNWCFEIEGDYVEK
jgi:hypothetical protein